MKLQNIIQEKVILNLEDLKDPELLKQIQTRLVELGIYPRSMVDGLWGLYTERAIKDFCERVHLNSYKNNAFGASFAEKLIETKPISHLLVTDDDHIRLIIRECYEQGILIISQIAYVLATVEHETAGKFRPINEIGSAAYLEKYEWRKDLGNIREGDAQRYRGRGYVQITGRRNYTTYAKLTGRDLVGHPELALDPYVAAFILVHGFKHGMFTSRKITHYIDSNKCDFRNARRCINGLDRCDHIASLAQKWLNKVKKYL